MAGYNESIIADNVDFLRSIKEAANVDMYIGGLMGCKGDAYTGEEALNLEEAIDFHSWQAGLFKSAKVDFLYAGIMPVLTEAIGMGSRYVCTEYSLYYQLYDSKRRKTDRMGIPLMMPYIALIIMCLTNLCAI